MNGNYEFNRHMATDKQRTFIQEAKRHRLAKQARDQGETWSIRAFIVRAGAWLQRSTRRAVRQAASRIERRTLPGRTRTATD